MFTEEQTKQLEAPLDRKHVAQRQQAGRSFSYIEGWHAIAEANRIFGFDAWNRETVDMRPLGEPYQTPGRNGEPTWRVAYMAKVRVTVYTPATEDFAWASIVREGCGFGSGIDRDLGQAHESALKEAETDAMKRALMTFGNPFGLALYDKAQANVVVGESAPERSPPARPIPPAVARSPDAPSGIERQMADALIAAGRAAASEADLIAWWRVSNTQATFNDLPEEEQDRVTNELAKHRQALQRAA